MHLLPQGRRWGGRVLKGSIIAIGIYAAVRIAFIAFILAAFAFGGTIG